MLNLEEIETEIRQYSEHLDLMSKIINSYSAVYECLKDVYYEFAKDYDTEFHNIQYILLIAQLEILLVLKSIYYAKSDYERVHLIKRGMLVIYEGKILLDKLNPTFKRIKDEFPELEIEFKRIVDSIKQFKKYITKDKRIEEIRNNSAAHINPNLLEYYNFLHQIEFDEDLKMIISFKKLLNQVDLFLSKVRFGINGSQISKLKLD